MSRMVFVTGFARGGTTWLRDCIASHPDAAAIKTELVLFRDHGDDRAAIEAKVEAKLAEQEITSARVVEKSPANAVYIDVATKAFPESKFLFIIRDPRDVFISHKRGTREWMDGSNKTVEGCMKKTGSYFDGYLRAEGAPNLMLVKYEDLHQNFHETLRRVFEFLGMATDDEILEESYKTNNFWNVATRNIEQRDKARRKGVVGDWVLFLEKREARWFKRNKRWRRFLDEYGYDWDEMTYRSLLRAMRDAGGRALTEDDLLEGRVDASGLNLLLCHDVDKLRDSWARKSITDLARTEAHLGLPSLFFFLPVDDPRYEGTSPKDLMAFMDQIRKIHPQVAFGLHLNAAERFFPKDAGNVGDDHPDMEKAVAYLHEQVDTYGQLGVTFRTATAHGYGRRKKRPNNRDSPVFSAELERRGIQLWDTILRPRIFGAAAHVAHVADVGGALSAREMPGPGSLIEAGTYEGFPAGTLVHVLTHPGNFDVRQPLTLGVRRNLWPAGTGARSDVSVHP